VTSDAPRSVQRPGPGSDEDREHAHQDPDTLTPEALELEVNALLHWLEDDRIALRPGQKATTTPDFCRKWGGRAERQSPLERSWEQLMPPPTSEWDAERREQRLFLKMLPHRLRRVVNRVFNTHHRGALLDLITDELGRRAAERGRVFETVSEGDDVVPLYEPRAYVPGCDHETILREMAEDGGFLLRLFKLAKATARQARAINMWTSPLGAVDAGQVRLPRAGAVELEAIVGLVATPLPHRPPEGLLIGLAQRFWGLGERMRAQRVLDWGAGNSAFTAALLSTSASAPCSPADAEAQGEERPFTVDEIEVLGDSPPECPFVSRSHSAPRGRVYDFVLIQLPPPCANRGGYRDRCKGLFAGRSNQERLRDLGRLGLARWIPSAPRLVRGILESVEAVGSLAILVPLFEVAAPRGEARSALLEARASIVEILQCMGVAVTHDFETPGHEALEPWSCLVASMTGGGCVDDAEDDQTIEEILRAV
jgi:hypothetical protein